MMAPLKVEDFFVERSTVTKKITGFTEDEMEEINHMDYRDMKKYIVNELNKRNHGLGTFLHNEHGVLSAWTDKECVFIEVGNEA